MGLDSRHSDILGFHHTIVGMLCGAVGLLAALALVIGVAHPTVLSLMGTAFLALFGIDTVHATWRQSRHAVKKRQGDKGSFSRE